MPATFRRAAGSAAVALAIAGCAHHPPPQVAVAPAPIAAPTPPKHSLAWEDSVVMAQMAHDRAKIAADRAAKDSAALRQMVFFAFDQALLTDGDRATLDQKYRLLLSDAKLRLRIAGDCDDRGSDEYNLALGQRRAAAAKHYLVNLGIDPTRIDIVSYGREKPVAPGENEQAWALNRNDQFVTIVGSTAD